MKVKSESEVAQLCPTLCDPMDCSLPGFSVPGILQARGLEWGATAFSYPTIQVTTNRHFPINRTGKPGILQSMGSQEVGRDGVAEQQHHELLKRCGEEISSCLIASDLGQHFLIFCLDLANSVFLLETSNPQAVHTLSFELFSSVVPQSPQARDECLVRGDLSIKSQEITLLPRMFGILWSPSESFSSFTDPTAQQLTLETDL